MRIFNTIIHQLVQVMINMVSDEGAAKHTARRAACRQGRGLPDLCEVDWPILLCRRSGSIACLIELNSDKSPDQYGYVGDPEGHSFVDLGLGGFLRSPENGNDAWRALATKFDGRFRTVTARNADKRPYPEFVKAYGENGYFKSPKEFVHFYNTRDTLPHCPAGSPGEGVTLLASARSSAKSQHDLL